MTTGGFAPVTPLLFMIVLTLFFAILGPCGENGTAIHVRIKAGRAAENCQLSGKCLLLRLRQYPIIQPMEKITRTGHNHRQGLANPARFMQLSARILPFLSVLTVIALLSGLFLTFQAPEDYQQGITVKIMFVHVPFAWLAMLCLSSSSWISKICALANSSGAWLCRIP